MNHIAPPALSSIPLVVLSVQTVHDIPLVTQIIAIMSESQEILTTTVTAESFLAAIIVLVVVPSLFVFVRVANSYRHTKGLYADDWFSIVAVVFLAIICALYYIMRTSKL
jgi:protein-S-isoprenylcysteine O-methyltransferase Ste14